MDISKILLEARQKAVEAGQPAGDSGVEALLYRAPRALGVRLSVFTEKQMARRKAKSITRGGKGYKNVMRRRMKDRQKFYRNYTTLIEKQRQYDKSLWGRWIRCRKYMNASEKRRKLGMMEFEEWEKLWLSLPPYKTSGQKSTPMHALRARHGQLPRVHIRRIDESRGMLLDNVRIVLEEQEGCRVLYDGNKKP